MIPSVLASRFRDSLVRDACKHMLALALSLGYFDRSSVTR